MCVLRVSATCLDVSSLALMEKNMCFREKTKNTRNKKNKRNNRNKINKRDKLINNMSEEEDEIRHER